MKHVVTAARLRHHVLVTGFGAFPGAPANPTAIMLRCLERQKTRLARLGIGLDCVVLPVVYAQVSAELDRAVATLRPDAILHLGLASRRGHVSIETRAINHAGALHPDASGRLPRAPLVASGGPRTLAATYPATRVLIAVRRQGVSARLSIDAGDYVCNATLYASLHDRAAPRVGFLHVPRPRRPNQPKARMTTRRPTIDALARAALAAILAMSRPL